MLGQEHVDDLATLVSRPVQTPPAASGLRIGLIGEPPAAGPVAGEPRRDSNNSYTRDLFYLYDSLGSVTAITGPINNTDPTGDDYCRLGSSA